MGIGVNRVIKPSIILRPSKNTVNPLVGLEVPPVKGVTMSVVAVFKSSLIENPPKFNRLVVGVTIKN